MEHIYRAYRISLRQDETGWHARFWKVGGAPVHLSATATLEEGCESCLDRARRAVDSFIAYVERP